MCDCLLIVPLRIITVMSAMATGGTLCSNRDMGENEGKKVQNEGASLPLVDRTDSNGPCQD